MDTGSDFIRPEFLNILFFQQKNLVIFPYVDMKHLHTLEIFTAGHNIVDLESTALHNLKEIIEFESSNSYAQNPTLFFISNTGKEQIQQIMALDGIRCIINSSENISDLANGRKFIFFNKKHGQFINYDVEDKELKFERALISNSQNKELLQEQIQKIKIVASRIFQEVNQNDNLNNFTKILKDYDKEYWNSIIAFTRRYYDINISDIDTQEVTSQKKLRDFSDEYEVLISTNKPIGKEFIQLLHNYRSKKVNPQHLELEELYNPLRLYNYLRNHHWKQGIPQDFISAWARMEISGYNLSDTDNEEFNLIIEKLGLPQNSVPILASQQDLESEESPMVPNISTTIPSLHTDWDQFKQWLMNRINNLEHIIDKFIDIPPEKVINSDLSEITSLIFSEISDLNHLLSPYRKVGTNDLQPHNNHDMLNQKDKILLVDITNILNLDKNNNGKLKVSNIAKVHDAILELGYTPKMWADASMRHHVDNKKQYERLLDKKIIHQTPAGTKADIWVLKIAKQRNYKFLTNDLYRKYREEFGEEWIAKNRLTCVYDEGDFIILEK